MVVLRTLALLAGLAAAGQAVAHVSVQPKVVAAGTYQVLRFGVGHGCDGKATTRLTINIPFAIESAKPQSKPGWRLSIERAPGQPDKVVSFTWAGNLPADQFDEFVMLVKLPPGNAGGFAFPAVQSCGATHLPWTGADPAHPPPAISVTPAGPPEGGHDHQH